MALWPFFLNINFKLLWFFFFVFVFFLADRLSPSCLISPHKCLLNTNVLERKCYSRKRSPVVWLHCLEFISFLEAERFPPQSISVSCLVASSAGVGVDSLAPRGRAGGRRASWSSRWLWTCERIRACVVCVFVCALFKTVAVAAQGWTWPKPDTDRWLFAAAVAALLLFLWFQSCRRRRRCLCASLRGSNLGQGLQVLLFFVAVFFVFSLVGKFLQ